MASLKKRFETHANGSGKKSSPPLDPLARDEPRLRRIPVEDILQDPSQPRANLGDLHELEQSIRIHGIIQPIVVTPLDETRYRILAGERRYTAAQNAGLATIPAIVRTVQDHERLELQIIENLHRRDLDPFEESQAYARLQLEYGLTHEQLAERIGKSRAYVTQILSLGNIPPQIRQQCQSSDKRISRDTLINIGKQSSTVRMQAVLDDALGGALSHEERRDRARKSEPRKPSKDPAPALKRSYDQLPLQAFKQAVKNGREVGSYTPANQWSFPALAARVCVHGWREENLSLEQIASALREASAQECPENFYFPLHEHNFEVSNKSVVITLEAKRPLTSDEILRALLEAVERGRSAQPTRPCPSLPVRDSKPSRKPKGGRR